MAAVAWSPSLIWAVELDGPRDGWPVAALPGGHAGDVRLGAGPLVFGSGGVVGAAATRARTRAASHARIEQAALELFRQRGFDRVTVEDVCAAAKVAPATFYRHFGTKEEVVFAYREGFAAVLGDAIGSAADLPEADRLPAILMRFAEFLQAQADVLAVRDEIVLDHPRLMQRTLAVQREFEEVLAGGLARLRGRPGPDSAARLEAGVGMVVLRVAVREWRQEGGSLLAATRRGLADLTGVVGRLPVPARS
jgi:AcrR family transcriptional regulator